MSWEQTAAEHIGHKAVLRDARTLECVQCQRKLILPASAPAGTPVPAPFRGYDRPGAVPMPAGWRDRVFAEIRARRELRNPPPETTP